MGKAPDAARKGRATRGRPDLPEPPAYLRAPAETGPLRFHPELRTAAELVGPVGGGEPEDRLAALSTQPA